MTAFEPSAPLNWAVLNCIIAGRSSFKMVTVEAAGLPIEPPAVAPVSVTVKVSSVSSAMSEQIGTEIVLLDSPLAKVIEDAELSKSMPLPQPAPPTAVPFVYE